MDCYNRVEVVKNEGFNEHAQQQIPSPITNPIV